MASFPVVVPKRRTIRLGGEKSVRETFSIDLGLQSHADIRQWGKNILSENLVEQGSIGNKPTLIAIDKSKTRPISKFYQHGLITFGVGMQRAIISQVQIELSKSIRRSTEIDTGKLEDIGGQWSWFYVSKTGSVKRVNPYSIKTLSGKERLMLSPNTDYAGFANSVVYKKEGKGFMGRTAEKLRRSRLFKTGFTIYVGFIKTPYMDRAPVLFIRSKGV